MMFEAVSHAGIDFNSLLCQDGFFKATTLSVIQL